MNENPWANSVTSRTASGAAPSRFPSQSSISRGTLYLSTTKTLLRSTSSMLEAIGIGKEELITSTMLGRFLPGSTSQESP